MLAGLYAEINVICIFLVTLILVKTYAILTVKSDKRCFIGVLVSTLLLFAFDLMWSFIYGGVISVSRAANFAVNALYLIMAGLVGFFWFMYCENKLCAGVRHSRGWYALCAAPVVILAVLCVASAWTHWLFYIDEAGGYHRGKLYAVQLVIGYGYMLCGSARALWHAVHEENYARRSDCYTLASFVVLPAIAGVLQTVFYGLPMLCVGIALSLLIVFMDIQERKISLDPLTQLNNRAQLIKYLSAKQQQQNRHGGLYLIMMDIDRFKSINDTYGHLEGDAALMCVAGVFKEVGGRENCFIARYGGDEFVVVNEWESEAEVTRFLGEMDEALAKAGGGSNSRYRLALSSGWAEYREPMTVQQLIAAADSRLYENKRAKYRAEQWNLTGAGRTRL